MRPARLFPSQITHIMPPKAPSRSSWLDPARGAGALEPLLECTTLLDVRWLVRFARGEAMVEREGVLPAWQELPSEAAVSLESLRAFTGFELPIVVLSYGWASAAHPDPTGEQLQLLLPVLESIVRFCDGHGGGRCSFGVLWDFASLPQKGHTDPTADPKAEDRTPEQLARFRAGLSSINAWCATARARTLAMIL